MDSMDIDNLLESAEKPLLAPEDGAETLWVVAYRRVLKTIPKHNPSLWPRRTNAVRNESPWIPSHGPLDAQDLLQLTATIVENVMSPCRPDSDSDSAQTLRNKLQHACQEKPYASILWVAGYTIHKCLLPDRVIMIPVYEQILSVLEKSEWYSDLFRLVFWTGPEQPPEPYFRILIRSLAALYTSVLGYHLHAAQFLINWLPLDMNTYMADIQVAENAFFNHLYCIQLPPQVSELLVAVDQAKRPHRLVNWLHEMGAVQRLKPRTNPYSHRLREWVSKTEAYRKFLQWNSEQDQRILWVRGGPGTGKSILLDAAVGALPRHCSYVCDSAAYQSNATSVVASLISGLLRVQLDFGDKLETVQSKSLDALSMLLCRLVRHRDFLPTCFVVDGIEQLVAVEDSTANNFGCITEEKGSTWNSQDKGGLSQLLHLVATTMRLSSSVRWILSVDSDTCDALLATVAKDRQRHIILSRDMPDLAEIVYPYALDKVATISQTEGYSPGIQASLADKMRRVPGNLLWTDLALDILQGYWPLYAPSILNNLIQHAPTVEELYRFRAASICGENQADAQCCESILYTAATAYRPLLISEFTALESLSEDKLVAMVNNPLSTFLEIAEGRVRFKHFSARRHIQRAGMARGLHTRMAEKCLSLFYKSQCTCFRDNDGQPTPGPWADYATTMWMDHLSEPQKTNASEPFVLHDHLMTVHLMDWLTLLGPETTISDICQKLRRLHAARASLGIAARGVLEEVILLLQPCHPEEEAIEDESKEINTRKLANRLLFATNLSVLPKILPTLFPWLEMLPGVGRMSVPSRILHTTIHSTNHALDCCFSPDGKLIALASHDGYVYLWEAQTGTLQQRFGKFEHIVSSVAMACTSSTWEGRTLLAAASSRTFKVWDVVTEDVFVEITGFPSKIALSPGAATLAVVEDNCVVIRDLAGQVRNRLIQYQNMGDVSIAFSPNGNFLASASTTEITLWDARGTYRVVCTLPSRGQNFDEFAEMVDLDEPGELDELNDSSQESNDESDKSTIQMNNAASETSYEESEVAEEADDDEAGDDSEEGDDDLGTGHTGYINGIAFSPDSKFLASASSDGTVRIWDLHTRETVAVLDYYRCPASCVAFSADGTYIATAGEDMIVAVWKKPDPAQDWGSGERWTRPYCVLRGHEGTITNLKFSPTGLSLVVSENSIRGCWVWDVGSYSADNVPVLDDTDQPGHAAMVTSVAVAPDGSTIASGSCRGSICFWDSKTGMELQPIDTTTHDGDIMSMAFSPNSQLLVTTSSDCTAVVWTVDSETDPTWMPIATLNHDDVVHDAQFSPDGSLLAMATDNGMVCLFQVLTVPPIDGVRTLLRPIKHIRTHRGQAYCVSFSPDGQRLASGSGRGVCIWKVDGDAEDRFVAGGGNKNISSYIYGVVFTADGSRVLSVSMDGSVAIWTPKRAKTMRCKVVRQKEGCSLTSSPFWNMRIHPHYPNVVLTDSGAFHLDLKKGLASDLTEEEAAACTVPGIKDNKTITWKGHSVIDLPERFRPFAAADSAALHDHMEFAETSSSSYSVHDHMAIIGTESGQVLLFRFTKDADPPALC